MADVMTEYYRQFGDFLGKLVDTSFTTRSPERRIEDLQDSNDHLRAELKDAAGYLVAFINEHGIPCSAEFKARWVRAMGGR